MSTPRSRPASPAAPAIVVGLGVALGLGWAGCGEDAEVEAEIVNVAGEANEDEPQMYDGLPVEAGHGGNVVMAGEHPFEVVSHSSGEVYAYIPDGETPPTGAELTIDVPVSGRSTGRPVRLRWNTQRMRYQGRVRQLEIIPGPLALHYEVGGHTYEGSLVTIVVAPAVQVTVVERPVVERPVVERRRPTVEIVQHRGRRKVKHRKHRRRGRHGRGRGRGDIRINF